MPRVAIFGAGGLGRVVLDTLLQAGAFEPIAFLDSETGLHGTAIEGIPVRGGMDAVPFLQQERVKHAVVAIGINESRLEVARALEAAGMKLVSAIHPLASISRTARLGKHLIIGPRATLCVHTTIADHAVISAGAIVDHDCNIGEAAFLHPAVRLAGAVHVDSLAVVGVGASVIPGRRIGRAARVEGGAVVIRDVAAGSTVAGAPAKVGPLVERGFVADAPTERLARRAVAVR